MRRFVTLLVLLVLVTSLAYAQPTIREGWPQDHSSASNNPFTSVNPLAIAEGSDGTRYIAAGTSLNIRLYTLDGTLVQEWATNDLVPAEPTADYLASGPQLADVDGDGTLEVVAMLRRNTASTKALAVLEMDGTLNTTLSRGHTLTSVDIAAFACADVDGDNYDEILYSTSTEIHAVDQDGTEADGFPWTVGRPHVGGGPVVVPGEYNNGTAIVVWPGQDLQMHAREFGATEDITGWPVSFSAPTGYQLSPPMVIPTDTGWMVAMVSVNGIYLWDQSGTLQDNFPVTPQNVDANLLMFSGAADLDGDNVPEIMFRSWNSDYISAVSLEGSYLTDYPYSTGTQGGRSESIAALRFHEPHQAYQFYGSLGPTATDLSLFGQQGNQALEGWPLALTVVENAPTTACAVFPPVDGIISIVYHTLMGFTTVYDYELGPTRDGVLEWLQPFSQANGNRVYQPEEFATIEGPYFAPDNYVSFDSLYFDIVELGQAATYPFQLSNVGLESGEITAIAFPVSGVDGDLDINAELPLTLNVDESAQWTITWTPSSVGELLDTLVITHSADYYGTETRILIGGIAVAYPDLTIPATLDLGAIDTDDPVTSAELEISNSGNGVGIIDTVIVAAAASSVLFVDESFPIEIEPGGNTSITVRWEPEEAGTFSSNLLIDHNDENIGGQTTVSVTGELVNDVAENGMPHEYALQQNYPNPFNPETTIQYSLKEPGEVTLKVFNIEGREVMTLVQGQRAQGLHKVRFDGRTLSSGVYLYSIEVNDFRALRKMVLVQ